MRSIWLAALVAAGCAWNATAAQENVEVGLLTCSLAEPTDAETGSEATGASARRILCAFKLNNGAEETYAGKVQVVNLPATDKTTLLWRVKAPPATSAEPGFLEQSYAADPRTPANQIPDLVGERNFVVLQSMADKEEGSAGAKERALAPSVTVLGVELKLKSTTG